MFQKEQKNFQEIDLRLHRSRKLLQTQYEYGEKNSDNIKEIIDQKVEWEAKIKYNELMFKGHEELQDAYFETYRLEQIQERLNSDISIEEGIRLESLKLQTLEQQKRHKTFQIPMMLFYNTIKQKLLYILEKKP